MEDKRKQDSVYRVWIPVAQGVLRLLLYICIILLVILAGKSAYNFGYRIFDQNPVAKTEEDAIAIMITIEDGDSVYEIGKTLQSEGMIENAGAFWMREFISDYHGDIQPGTYRLNSYQTIDEMLAVLSKENTEGQPHTEEEVEDTKQ